LYHTTIWWFERRGRRRRHRTPSRPRDGIEASASGRIVVYVVDDGTVARIAGAR
jgi:hypothetical protein